MESYTIKTTGHRRLTTTFTALTNKMNTVNIAYELDGWNIELGGLGYSSAYSFGKGNVADLRMSTNSTSGKATLTCREVP